MGQRDKYISISEIWRKLTAIAIIVIITNFAHTAGVTKVGRIIYLYKYSSFVKH